MTFPAPPPQPEMVRGPNTTGPYKILVVDDEPDLQPLILQRMRRPIRNGQYRFVFAQNGIEALRTLASEPDIDLVVSDINMPQMDGLTLLEQIPSVNPNIRSIIISAYGDMQNIRTAMNRGAFDFVTKPLDFKDLRHTIDRTLRNLVEWREALASRDQLVMLQNELDLASKIQLSILPTEFPTHELYQVHAHMEPARNVGGDFYDVIMLERDHIGVAVADVSDKGVPASLFMMSSRTLLKGTAIGGYGPGQLLADVNDLLYADNETTMFVTIFYAVYSPVTGEMNYANGGHNPPLIIHSDGSSDFLPQIGGVALGIADGLTYRQSSIFLQPGDTALLYTDGVTEAMNADSEEFGTDRLQAIFRERPPRSAQETNDLVFEAVHAFAGDVAQSDDITCLAISRAQK
ncbi:MAG: SpoIIE family protein phosphatase [bacterium]|nr:SpoIIE family protein phosphatase [bacterium]MXX64145.1 SpoIIE family protein phosphatase [Acidimicrobiia bacterium]MCY3580603.1 SpoIIE family protein phosphatase [bacterium]MCY3652404.1 SpoIIE family protein phosphatase [bacterium]MDE0644151.1 SpoIIE family protein phosphatase [bacterium]